MANVESLTEHLAGTKVLPLYTAIDMSLLDPLEELLIKHDIRLIEVTFRSELALKAIEHLARSGKLLVGAGTVRTLEEAQQAVAKGAQFIVSPAIVPEVIDHCLKNQIPIFPGTATPNDIQKAVSFGIKTVKFFPADIYGGLQAIKALSGPFYDVRFLPTGGISKDNCQDYLAHPQVIAVGGSFILSEELVRDYEQGDAHLASLKAILEST